MQSRHALWAEFSETVIRLAVPALRPSRPTRFSTEPARLSRAELIDLFAADLRAPAAVLLPRRALAPDRAG
ncbi:hypothetical protein [Albidovulum sediminis]|uniref:Uncharacterized protein n=1 Tax=Albidovulum sediminis TaxID=3066345 RepID=A0ABT2NJ25_9RHOB|nr:hypothetical protein [Defluviimonas sediminis]MCT8328930.1 hypothetical protein [Defluviimonas sediminis]